MSRHDWPPTLAPSRLFVEPQLNVATSFCAFANVHTDVCDRLTPLLVMLASCGYVPPLMPTMSPPRQIASAAAIDPHAVEALYDASEAARVQLPPPVEIQMFAVVTPPLPVAHAEVVAETVEV